MMMTMSTRSWSKTGTTMTTRMIMTIMTTRVSQLLDLIKTQYFHKDIMDINDDDEDNNNNDKYSQNCKNKTVWLKEN